jgi:zinc transporter
MLSPSGSSYAQLINRKGIIYGFLFEAAGRVCEVGWAEIQNWQPATGFLWLHLDRKDSRVIAWLKSDSELEEAVWKELLAEEPYQNSSVFGDALLLLLRGVNLNPDADPEDMVTVRLWVEAQRVISLRGAPVRAAQDIHDHIRIYHQPSAAGDFLVAIITRLLERLGRVLTEMEDQLDALEEDLLDNVLNRDFRSTLRRLRRQSIALRRHIAPQHAVVKKLTSERVSWLTEPNRADLQELAEQTRRYVEDLGAMRERIVVIDEELSALANEQINRTIFILSLVTAVFLPLSFVTGLLGINVGGIPGADAEWGFIVVCVILGFIIAAELFFFYHYLKKRQF